jgi:hypothetical protein
MHHKCCSMCVTQKPQEPPPPPTPNFCRHANVMLRTVEMSHNNKPLLNSSHINLRHSFFAMLWSTRFRYRVRTYASCFILERALYAATQLHRLSEEIIICIACAADITSIDRNKYIWSKRGKFAWESWHFSLTRVIYVRNSVRRSIHVGGCLLPTPHRNCTRLTNITHTSLLQQMQNSPIHGKFEL